MVGKDQTTGEPITEILLLKWMDDCQTQNNWGIWRTDYTVLAARINKHFGVQKRSASTVA